MTNRPNLLFIYTNGLRADALGFCGNDLAYTPYIDAFAKDCVRFTNAVSAQPLETPYAASLFTGKYSVETGAVINEVRLSPDENVFGKVLSKNGYDTLFYGRWHLYAAQLGHYFNTKNSYVPEGDFRFGFDTAFGAFNGSGDYFAPRSYYHLNSSAKLYSKGFEPDFQTDLAVEKLSEYENSDTPFAMFLSYGVPSGIQSEENVPKEYYDIFRQTDFPNPPNYSEKNDPHADIWSRFFGKDRNDLEAWKRCYAAMTAALDADFGRLTDALRKFGLYDNTVIVFTSSKGEMFGAHGRRSANIFYDEAVRVPFLLRYGKKFTAGDRTSCLNTPDIMPTLLSLLGVECPEKVSGKDMSEAIKTDSTVSNDCLLLGTGPAAIWGDGREWRGIRTDGFTYAVYLGDGEEFLFDNKNDPYQLNNLSENDSFSEIRERLKSDMHRKMEKIGDSFEKNSFYKKNYVSKRKIVK